MKLTSSPSPFPDAEAARIDDREPLSGVPVLEPRPSSNAERFSRRVGAENPIRVFVAALLGGYALLVGAMVLLGLALIELVLPIGGLAEADQNLIEWLADRRSSTQEDLSWVGSTLAGGLVIPAVIGACLFVFLLSRRWRLAAFVFFVVVLESGTYSATTRFIHRDRPDVERLESLPVDASYPSGHVAASIALYGGLLLLLASKTNHAAVRIAAVVGGVAIPLFVAWARLYRGMHHITDIAAGVLLGLGALAVLVFASHAAGAAAERRDARRRELTREVSV